MIATIPSGQWNYLVQQLEKIRVLLEPEQEYAPVDEDPLDSVTEKRMWALITGTGDRLIERGKLRARIRELLAREIK